MDSTSLIKKYGDRYRLLSPYYPGRARCNTCSTRTTVILVEEADLAEHDLTHRAAEVR